MEKTARSLIKLLQAQDPNLRLAAMRVVAALEMRNKPVVEALGANLESDVEALQVQALRALAQLGPADAIHLVAPKILEGGVVRQHAAQVLVMGGGASVPVLRRLYARADFHGRRAIASTLADIGGRPVFQFLLRALPSEDLEMTKHLTGCLRAVIRRLPKPSRLTAVSDVHTFLKDRKTQKSPHAVIAGLVLLGGVSDPKAVEEAQKMLLGFLDRRQTEPVRRNAAVSLSRLPVNPKTADALVPKLVPLLCEADWSPVPQNVLPLLQRLEPSPAAVSKLVPLLRKSPHATVRMHVLGRLHGSDKPATVREVLPFLAAQNPRLREAAEAALKTMPSAIDALFELLLGKPDDDVTRRVQWILRAYTEAERKRYAARAAERVLELHEKGDARAHVCLDFVCGADPSQLQKRIAARIKTLKRSSARNRWDRMAGLLKLLADRNLLMPEQRYEYGLTLLRKSHKDVRRESRAADPSLHVLSGLARQDGARLVRSLVKERALGAEDYYYLGFHLIEGNEEMRDHGRSLLSHLARRYPRHKLGRAAKQKIGLLDRRGATVEA
ncbi:MAG: hypothetical protein ACE5G2_02520 [Candidatus Krumholzibacteriia bacterium]